MELLVAGPGVLEPPDPGEAVVLDAEEVDLFDVHGAAGGWEVLPAAELRAGTAEAGHDRVVLGDQLNDLLVPVGEGVAELVEGAAKRAGQRGGGDLVEGAGIGRVDDVIDEPADEDLGIGTNEGR